MSEFSEAEKKELLATAHDLRNVADESLALLAAENEKLRTRLAEAESEQQKAYRHMEVLAERYEKEADILERGNADLRTRLAEAEKEMDKIGQLSDELFKAEQRGRALLAVARAVHPMFSRTANEYGACGICHRITHQPGCDCPVAKLDAEYPGWRTEWRHGRPHDARMAEDHDEA